MKIKCLVIEYVMKLICDVQTKVICFVRKCAILFVYIGEWKTEVSMSSFM